MNEYYKEKLMEGLAYQDFVTEELYKIGLPIISYSSKKYQHTIGENKCGFEIKYDGQLKKYGNLYIETAEKSDERNKDYIESGIYRNDNTWLYIIGNYDQIFILSKKHLRYLYEDERRSRYFRRITKSTSLGFLIPAKYAEEKLAVLILKP